MVVFIISTLILLLLLSTLLLLSLLIPEKVTIIFWNDTMYFHVVTMESDEITGDLIT